MGNKKPIIHFWVPYPERVAPSQRFRVELFFSTLEKEGYPFKIFSFLDENAWSILYSPGKEFSKAIGFIRGLLRRTVHLFRSVRADYIFLHREAAPLGPPVFEWLLAKVFKKKIIHEFDDAIWIPGGEEIGNIKNWLKATWKIKYIIKWSYKVVGGNEFLCNYAKRYNNSVILLPTVVDTDSGHHLIRNQFEGNKVVVGWTGSHSTLHNLEEIEEVIQELKKITEFDLLIISNKAPNWNFDFIFKKWEEKTELEDLLKIHIGLMPLKKGPWFEGKCGFKLIQYLACGIPAIASPVGVNSLIVRHNIDGFIAADKAEWIHYLKILINDQNLRNNMGKKGRDRIVEQFSLDSQRTSFLDLFNSDI